MCMNVNVNGCLEAQMDGELYQEEPGTVFSLSCSRWHTKGGCWLRHLSQILGSCMSPFILIVVMMIPGGFQNTGRTVIKIEGIAIKNFRWTPSR